MLAYSIRAGLGTMTRALALAKAGQYRDLRGWRLVSESGLKYRCAYFLVHPHHPALFSICLQIACICGIRYLRLPLTSAVVFIAKRTTYACIHAC